MKNRFFIALVLAGLVTGVLLLWHGQVPSPQPSFTGSEEIRPQGEPEADSGAPPVPGERDGLEQISSRHQDSAEMQANGDAAAGEAASKHSKIESDDNDGSGLPDDQETEGFVIAGHVLDEEGNPQPNIEVLAELIRDARGVSMQAGPTPQNVQPTFTDFSGAFLFDQLEDGEYRVRLAPVAGIAPAETRVRAGTINANLVAVVLRDVRVYGTVSSTRGAPIEDVQLVAAPTVRNSITGSEGEYELNMNWQGKDVVYSVLFQHRGFRQQRIRISPADLESPGGDFQLDVSMEPVERLTTVAGRLADTNGNPVSGETIHLLTSQLRTWYRAQSDADGSYMFEEVEPGNDHRLRIRPASRYKNKDISPLRVPDTGLQLDIVLEPVNEGELAGWMIDLDGHPVPGLSLTLRSAIASAQSVSVVGDQQGFFLVEDFPVGEALFRTNSYPVLMVQGIQVSAEPEEPVMIILDTGRHMLRGRVKDRFGEPVAQSSITLGWAFRDQGLQSSSTRKTSTDQNGNFVFTGLGPDLHTMEVSAAGFITAIKTIDVGADPFEILIELQEVTQ